MNKTLFHTAFAPLREHLPPAVARAVRATATAVLTPLHFTQHTGHWLSSLRTMAVSPSGQPIPWYTYPCLDFLAARAGRVRTVLEFGAGQSTLWWSAQGADIVAFEGDRSWYEYLRTNIPGNVALRFATSDSPEACIADVQAQLRELGRTKFDAVIVDGLYRTELAALAPSLRADNGIIICDDSEGYEIKETLQGSGLNRVDFFGYAPGVSLPRCTSIYFSSPDLFDASIPVSAQPG